jgi:hypothetical protein
MSIDIKRVKSLLSKDYTKDVVEISSDFIKLVNKFKQDDYNYTLLKDIIMSANSNNDRDLLFKAAFALVNINVLDMEFINSLTMTILPFDDISKNIMFPDPKLVYKDEITGENITLHKKYIEMVVTIKSSF